jgi:crotonobetainyl-CoA:carnitine CoA-transferase CaiB-like acyl-CoA transferase
MTVAALEPKFWVRLCERLGVDDLREAAFAVGNDAERVAERLESVFATRTRAQWREHLGADDVCCEPMLTIEEVLDDAQVRHRAQDAEGDPVWFPFRVGARAHAPLGPPPASGADSRALLAEVGVTDDDYELLVAAGVTA